MSWQPPASDFDWQPPESDFQETQSAWQATQKALGSRPELQPYSYPPDPIPTDPVGGALNMVRRTLEAPIRLGQTLSSGPQVLGETITEEGALAGYPKAGLAVGGAIAMAPYLLGAYGAMKGLYGSTNPVVKGLVNTPQELSPQYTAQNKAIGVTRRIPREGGTVPKYAPNYEYPSMLEKPKYSTVESPAPKIVNTSNQVISPNPSTYTEVSEAATPNSFARPRPQVPAEQLPGNVPVRYPSKTGDFMAYANQKIATHGKNINPQELMDWQVKLQTDMSNGTIPRIDPTTGNTTTVFQQATELSKKIKGLFNPIAEQRLSGATLPEGTITTRAGLDKAYGISQTVRGITKKVGKVAATVSGAVALEEYLKRRFYR